MNELKLGQIITDDQQRDAIHIAVAPVVAAESMNAGQRVGLDADGRASLYADPAVGIVDPFLLSTVHTGQMFWMFMFPNTITSLRHEWTHPAFAADPAITIRSTSEQWMRAWAVKHVSDDWDGTLSEDEAYAFAIKAGHEHYIGSNEDARNHMNSEWWAHWEAITGSRGDREAFFRCAC